MVKNMWGVVGGIFAASLALAVLEQTLRSSGTGDKAPQKPGALPEPDKDSAAKKSPGKRPVLLELCRAAGTCLPVQAHSPDIFAISLVLQTASSQRRYGS